MSVVDPIEASSNQFSERHLAEILDPLRQEQAHREFQNNLDAGKAFIDRVNRLEQFFKQKYRDVLLLEDSFLLFKGVDGK